MTTTNKLLEQPAAGSLNWDVPLNDNAGYIDAALGSSATITGTSGTVTLATSEFRCMCLKSTALVFTADVTYVIPSGVGGQWIVKNQSASSAFNLIIKNAASSTSVTIANGQTRSVWSDGNGVFLSDDIDIATQAEAEAGTNNTALMTPLRTKQSITSEIATQAQAQAGTDNTTLMTPLRTFQSVSTAPSLNSTAVLAGVATATVNSVGAYVYASSTLNALNTGDGVAGGNLSFCLVFDESGTRYVALGRNNTLTGSWRLMSGNFTTSDENCGLFVRYA